MSDANGRQVLKISDFQMLTVTMKYSSKECFTVAAKHTIATDISFPKE
jgi:hypothetical protein